MANDEVVGRMHWAPDFQSLPTSSPFKATSAFDQPITKVPPPPSTPPKVTAYQGETVEVKKGELRSWWHDLDDALAALETTNLRGHDEAIEALERLKDHIDDVIRSKHASTVRPDRDPR